MKHQATEEVDAMATIHSADGRSRSSATASWASRRSRPIGISSTSFARTASRCRKASPEFRPRSWRRGAAGSRSSRSGPTSTASRSPPRSLASRTTPPLVEGAPGARRRPQLRAGGQHHRRHCRQEADGTGKTSGTIRVWPGTAEELVATKAYLRSRGLLQGRRRRAVHARRQRAGGVLGRSRGNRARVCRVPRSAARPRIRPARRGAGEARSTRWS